MELLKKNNSPIIFVNKISSIDTKIENGSRAAIVFVFDKGSEVLWYYDSVIERDKALLQIIEKIENKNTIKETIDNPFDLK